MKVYGGVDVKSHVFLTPALVGGEWSASLLCRFYPRGKSPRYPLAKRLSGPQSRSGRYGEVKILDSTGTRISTSRTSCQWSVAIPTALPRLIESRKKCFWKAERGRLLRLTNLPPCVSWLSRPEVPNLFWPTAPFSKKNYSPPPFQKKIHTDSCSWNQ
jgi:hypothetical protein